MKRRQMAIETGTRKRILCIDDDEDTRDLMRVLLEKNGYEAIVPTTVSDALKSAKSGGLDLYILDHWMSEMDGIELCREIRAFDPGTPIMFYSGAGYQTDIKKGLDAGAQAYLVKPDFDHLEQTIDRLICEWGFNHSATM